MYSKTYDYLESKLKERNTNLENTISLSHVSQSSTNIYIGNLISSLNKVSKFNWKVIFEEVSIVENILRKDPSGIYGQMDFNSRNHYRTKLEKICKKYDIEEVKVASEAVRLSKENDGTLKERHIGYYIAGKGDKDLLESLDLKMKFRLRKEQLTYLYIIIISILGVLSFAIAFQYFGRENYNMAAGVLLSLMVAILASDFFVKSVNYFLQKLYPISFLPKLELKDGIPSESKTFVVIPTLITSEEHVEEIFEKIEEYYLANKSENLYFALLGEFMDSDKESEDRDDIFIKTAKDITKELNKKYSTSDSIFYYLQRKRHYNEKQCKWMCWERKRGSLTEFNNLILGHKSTSHKVISSDISHLIGEVKYIITLDEDTKLPIDTARKLIGTISHPLNEAVYDDEEGKVIEGFGVIQPNVSIGLESSCASKFTKIYARTAGSSIYVEGFSDLYQDVFNSGIFYGKGIYNLRIFSKILNKAIPQNKVLSHDLLEGSHTHVAYASDINIVDTYPTKYISYLLRLHRWIRGDWQLVSWLFPKVKDSNNMIIRNPISPLSKWKIFDNLRRSLISVALFAFVIGLFTFLPKPLYVWIVFGLAVVFLPLVLEAIESIIIKKTYKPHTKYKKSKKIKFNLKGSFQYILIQLVFLPIEANITLSAIVISLYRILVSKKNLLEWTTAAVAETKTKNSLKKLMRVMKVVYIEIIGFLVLSYIMRPELFMVAFIVAFIWALAPFLVKLLDKKEIRKIEPTKEEISVLRKDARKIWSYFEDFSRKNTNYLPPDNYQEYPPKEVAERTSPTNIGLSLLAIISARDLGFVSITRVITNIRQMLTTIDKLEKWNGNLYNWYNTKTLEVLRPKYVSSVDSGNYLGYLMVLKQSLIQYKDMPIIDDDIVQGIKETCELEQNLSKEIHDIIDSFGVIKGKTSSEWINFLKELKSKVNRSSTKTSAMIDELTIEYSKYFSLRHYEEEKSLQEDSLYRYILQEIGKIPMELSLPEVKRYYMDLLVEIRQHKIKSKETHHNTVIIENKLKSIINNLDELLRELDEMTRIIDRLAHSTAIYELYDYNKDLFSIGYDCENNQLTDSYYDLLASEARATSFIGIVTKQIPVDHWYKLGRTFTVYNKNRILASWSGTMFEYFMPNLMMKNYEYSIFDETYHSALQAQIDYGNSNNKPWGVSESGYYYFDLNLNYQYKACGIPNIGFKRGLINDYVVSPYSTYLALNFNKEACLNNLNALRTEGAEGPYGLYEAIDYTEERLNDDEEKRIVKSYMAHHLGMSLLSINNFINDNIMQERFHENPIVKTGELFLEEKLPYKILMVNELNENEKKKIAIKPKEYGTIGVYDNSFNTVPNCHLISNKNYHVMVANNGFTYSKYQDKMITRFRSHVDQRYFGYTFFFKDVDDKRVWSVGSEPITTTPKKYEVIYSLNKAEIIREDSDIDTHLEMWISSEDNVEMRSITLMNKKSTPVNIEITSYAELAMMEQNADLSHPAFNNLFISTEYDEETGSLIAVKKPRESRDQELYVFKTFSTTSSEFKSTQFETNRNTFIGRGRSLSKPVALDKFLENTEGVVLEPILSLRNAVKIEGHQKVQITYSMGVAKNKDEVNKLINKYRNPSIVKEQLELSEIQAQVEMSYLDLNIKELELYQAMISQLIYLSPNRRKYSKQISENNLGQKELWKYGISGDNPIILYNISSMDEKENLWTLIKGKEYCSLKGLQADLLILNNQEVSYYKNIEEEIRDMISMKFGYNTDPQNVGVYLINGKQLNEDDRKLLYASSNIVLGDKSSSLLEQIELEETKDDKNIKRKFKKYQQMEYIYEERYELKYFNGYGGFNEKDSEYVIQYRENLSTPMPWINVISNDNFGFIISESGGGFTWSENSNENKLTPWLNDTIFDIPQEVVYLKDEEYGELWSLTPEPLGHYLDYDVCHGKGYTKFSSKSYGLENSLNIFASLEDSVKIYSVKLKNHTDEVRKISSFLFVNPLLGGDSETNRKYITSNKEKGNIITLNNPFNHQYPNRTMYISSSEVFKSYTGNKDEFNLKNLKNMHVFSNEVGGGLDPCGGIQIQLNIEPNEEKQFLFILGQETDIEKIKEKAQYYQKVDNCNKELAKVRGYWENTLSAINIETPDNKLDTLVNSYLPYQTLACRIKARSAFYQTGGAYGFRDQIQDSLNMMMIDPDITRKQILLNASHQFKEGDVLHWWHPGDEEKGVRTRFADDLLWLPYAVAEYLLNTEDYKILDKKLHYVTGETLDEDENEIYMSVGISEYKETLYEHCIKAIDHALEFGSRGLPLMKGGDWNDGMNKVGIEGKGESVWLGWFLAQILKRFSKICMEKDDRVKSTEYLNHQKDIIQAIEEEGWDGSWYRRAYYDDGTPLGSKINSECKIASLPQSWSVISTLGNEKRSKDAMESVNNHLILDDKGMILLFAPPFERDQKDPGYIKSYAKGLRENGGQYTHAAAWVIYAYALLGEGKKAYELYEMLNPINHSRSFFSANLYKVEPYVISADIYYVNPHVGRGGWTWYTGAAGWMYRVCIEGILGLKKRGTKLMINPSIPNNWRNYNIKYRYKETLYIIEVVNHKELSNGNVKYTFDDKEVQEEYIELVNDKNEHRIRAEIIESK
ncbi:GH36-type glycosyl hydrolase domain-containing protein [Gudongella sp. DL1XJH-153]|uniref:GH36-type glycosyl hydrolase domain-containing protein n=1 Tax=Gudongella sp. DL1XJH-153 TaxID=3409804 RepID=UPI003BB4E22A